ncbi:hypothetical protein P8822_00230 [Bacillus sonorensis]|uniref:hypothetical protein n=1 Tax=Bacillus sonorensis TaxID=119858 RepID=UPI002DBE9768|nr:hypothetical protein [Bacillus sonorensis]MEC0526241.1 hypothetical protein [Bacillus sonorensis]
MEKNYINPFGMAEEELAITESEKEKIIGRLALDAYKLYEFLKVLTPFTFNNHEEDVILQIIAGKIYASHSLQAEDVYKELVNRKKNGDKELSRLVSFYKEIFN